MEKDMNREIKVEVLRKQWANEKKRQEIKDNHAARVKRGYKSRKTERAAMKRKKR